MSIYKKYIRRLIEEEVENFLSEQNVTPPEEPVVEPSPEPSPDTAGSDTPTDTSTDTTDTLDLDLGGDATGATGDLSGGAAGDDAGLDTLEDDNADESLDDAGGGDFGGFSGGGGGFSFGGDDGDSGLGPDEDEEEETATTVGPEDVEMPDDPVMSIVDEAIEMLKTTQQPAPILKTVKSSIQRYFNDFDDATPVIKALWDTEDLILRDVARRLLLFIRGV